MKRLAIALSALLFCVVGARLFGVIARGPDGVALPDYDIRADHRRALLSLPRQTEPRFRLLRDNPRARIRWSSLTGAPSRVQDLETRLTSPSSADAEIVARRFLIQNEDLFGLRASEIEALRVLRRYTTEHNGVTHITLQQAVNGIDVFQGSMAVHLDRTRAVISSSGELLPGAADLAAVGEPRLKAERALLAAAEASGAKISGPVTHNIRPNGANQQQQFDRHAGFARHVDAKLVYFPLTSGQLRPAWEFYLWMRESPDAYQVLVDAERGVLLYRYNLTCYDENPLKPHGLVFDGESPKPNIPFTGNNNPQIVERQDLPFRAVAFNGSPIFQASDPHFDWWAGTPANSLVSNNTDAHLDRDSMANVPDLPRLEALDGNFSFPINFLASPATDDNARSAQVNLFYWVNRYHDILYSFGFNEAAGNFQTSNFNSGGIAGDAIQADAQDGLGFNNANFATPPDGGAGRVQMYLWDAVDPNLDGDFDQGVIIHELTHGLSNRLVGNAAGLTGAQSRGMGEGWSDYFALVLQRSENDDPDGVYPVGQYVTRAASRGVRRYPYSTSMTISPLTFGRIAENNEVHAVGEVWCNMLWEMRRLLVDRYGFREGQRQSIQLVVDGMKLTPLAPSFTDARDAILLADRVNNNGANLCLIGKAFAKRGMGYSSNTTDAGDFAPVEAFDEGPYCSDTGTLALDRSNYLANEEMRITLFDHNGALPLSVQVRNTASGDVETLQLAPDGSIPGSFYSSVRLSAGGAHPGDGILQGSTRPGDEILVSYQDRSTASGGISEITAHAGVAREGSAFFDNVEHGNRGWIPTGTWGITTATSESAIHSWMATASGNDVYLPGIALTSPLLDLSGFSDVTLNFSQSYELFGGFNYGVVEYSINDGASWLRVKAYTGSHNSYEQAQVRLRGLDRQQRARIRFRLQNALAIGSNSWAIDDVSIFGRSADPQVISPDLPNAPVIISVAPAYGPPEGGTTVRITGTNFTETEDTSVTLDGLPATRVSVLGNTTLVAVVPAHSVGPVTVRVSNRLGTTAVAAGFTYYQSGTPSQAPSLATIFPSSGSNRGGTVVTLIGSGFTPATVVNFGAFASQVTFVNATTLRAITPRSQGTGPVDVSARNGAQQATITGAFNYTSPTPPQVQLISPNGGDTLYAGSTTTISWRSSDNRAVAGHRLVLRYMNGPVSFQAVIANEVPGESQSFNWTIPLNQPPTTQARAYITAVDDEGAEAESSSGSDFTIAQRWERISSLPQAVMRLQSATDGKSIFAMGGRAGTTNSTTVNTVSRYDPAENRWTNQGLQPMQTGINAGDAAFLNGRIFVPGGFSNTTVSILHFAYDIATNAWVQRADVPSPVFFYSLVADESKGVFHLTGGNNNSTGAVASSRSYDVNANAWTALPAMATARYGHESAIIDGKLYVIGGIGTSGGLVSGEAFDFGTGQWSPIASLNTPRSNACGTVTRDANGNPLWLLVGGINPLTNLPLGAELYDVRNNRWAALDNSFSLTSPRAFLGGVTLGSFFYSLGGASPFLASAVNERIRIDTLTPVGANQPPVLVVPVNAIGTASDELRFYVTASDLGSSAPVGITAAGLPPGAGFTTSTGSNNSARGLFVWTPSPGDRGQTFIVSFTASDGQSSDTKLVTIQVVDAAPLAAVNAADFRPGPLAPESIVAAFGADLAVRTETAQTLPLPFELAGTSVFVNGLPVQLFFASVGQVNLAMPPGLEPGQATILIRNSRGTYSAGKVTIERAVPAIFTANSTGTGDAAAIATADGITYQEPPFDVTFNGRPNVLILFGTGFRHAPAANHGDDNGVAEAVSATIDGKSVQTYYAGAQGQYSGLDQLNLEIPQSLGGGPSRRVEVGLSINGITANRVTIQIN